MFKQLSFSSRNFIRCLVSHLNHRIPHKQYNTIARFSQQEKTCKLSYSVYFQVLRNYYYTSRYYYHNIEMTLLVSEPSLGVPGSSFQLDIPSNSIHLRSCNLSSQSFHLAISKQKIRNNIKMYCHWKLYHQYFSQVSALRWFIQTSNLTFPSS